MLLSGVIVTVTGKVAEVVVVVDEEEVVVAWRLCGMLWSSMGGAWDYETKKKTGSK